MEALNKIEALWSRRAERPRGRSPARPAESPRAPPAQIGVTEHGVKVYNLKQARVGYNPGATCAACEGVRPRGLTPSPVSGRRRDASTTLVASRESMFPPSADRASSRSPQATTDGTPSSRSRRSRR